MGSREGISRWVYQPERDICFQAVGMGEGWAWGWDAGVVQKQEGTRKTGWGGGKQYSGKGETGCGRVAWMEILIVKGLE